MKHRQKWGNLVINGRTGRQTLLVHTGTCQHTPAAGETHSVNRRVPACSSCRNLFAYRPMPGNKPLAALAFILDEDGKIISGEFRILSPSHGLRAGLDA